MCLLRPALSLSYFSIKKMMLSFQLGGILIVPDRKLADHIKSERKREKEKESVCTFTVYMCLLSGAEKEMTSSQQRINTFWW